MRLLVAIVGAVLIAGCGPTYRYTHPQFTEEQWKKDRYECKSQAAIYQSTQRDYQGGLGDILAAKAGANHFKECLEARGYTAVPVESPPQATQTSQTTQNSGSIEDLEWKAQERLVRASRLRVSMPLPVRGTIKRIALVHPNEPQQLAIGGSLEKVIRMMMEQTAFDLRMLIPRLEVVERSNIDAAIRELQFQMSGLVRDEELVRLGRMLAADHLLLYEISVTTDKELEVIRYHGGVHNASVSCRILNVETGALVYRETIFHTATVPLPLPGGEWDVTAVRQWAVSRILHGSRISLAAAFDPKFAETEIPFVGDLESPQRRGIEGPGAEVGLVLIGSPAERAGIREGDLIMKVNGIPINSPQDVRKPFGTRTTVTVRRGTEDEDYVVHADRP